MRYTKFFSASLCRHEASFFFFFFLFEAPDCSRHDTRVETSRWSTVVTDTHLIVRKARLKRRFWMEDCTLWHVRKNERHNLARSPDDGGVSETVKSRLQTGYGIAACHGERRHGGQTLGRFFFFFFVFFFLLRSDTKKIIGFVALRFFFCLFV